jgi:hypothetical protein
VFSNYFTSELLTPLLESCANAGIALDVAGSESGRAHARPEALLGEYDLVFAKARCALEALAVGCAVVCCGTEGLAEMVRAERVAALRADNLGARCLTRPLRADLLAAEIAAYDPAAAARARDAVRAVAGLDTAIGPLRALYREVVDAATPAARAAWSAALPAEAAAYLARQPRASVEPPPASAAETAVLAGALAHSANEAATLRATLDGAQSAMARTESQLARTADELARAYGTITWRWRERVLRTPGLRRAWSALRGDRGA